MNSSLLATTIVDALIYNKVIDYVVSPGSRNAPLLYALGKIEDERVRSFVRIDERDAGFTALGLSLVSAYPSAIFVTSGTAVANLFPAILEARHSGVPLLIITADRPEELQGTGANQTTRQANIFGDKVVSFYNIATNEDETFPQQVFIQKFQSEKKILEEIVLNLKISQNSLGNQEENDIDELQEIIKEAVEVSCGDKRQSIQGPVHINVQFREPLIPSFDASGQVSSNFKGTKK